MHPGSRCEHGPYPGRLRRGRSYPRRHMSSPGHALTPLRVAMLAPISWRVPPRHYGPWEQFVSPPHRGLVHRGVQRNPVCHRRFVTERTWLDRSTAIRRCRLDPKVCEKPPVALSSSGRRLQRHPQQLLDFLPLTYSGLIDTPVVTTIHGFSSRRSCPSTRSTTTTPTRHDQRRQPHPGYRYVATIHHGIDMQAFEVVPTQAIICCSSDDPSAQGTVEAIEVAERSGCP